MRLHDPDRRGEKISHIEFHFLQKHQSCPAWQMRVYLKK